MIRVLLTALWLWAFVQPAFSQVQQSGTVTPGHVAIWTTNGVIRDAGTAAVGNITSLGITAAGPSLCINSALVSAAGWQTLCLGATTGTGGLISLQNFGTASAFPLGFLSNNGIAFVLPPTGGTAGQFLTTDGAGNTSWSSPAGAGTVTSVATGAGLTGGPVTTTGTISCAAFNTASLSCVPASGGGTTNFLRADGTWTSPTSASAITALTGDGTAAGPGSATLTLATVNPNVGTFGSSTAIPTITVNEKGLITAASSNVVVAPAGTLTGTTLAATVVTSSLTSVGTIATGVWNGTIVTGTYGGTGINNGASTITVAGNFAVTTNGGTLSFGAASKTLTINNSLAFSGTDGTVFTFPGASDTVAALGAAQTFTAQNQWTVARTITSATNATWQDLLVNASTTTITGTTAITGSGIAKVWIGQPTLTDSSAVTITNAATLYIDGPVAAAGSVTITNPWAIYLNAGNVRFPGTNTLGTIASGVWNGSAIGVLFGGTGLTGGTSGGVLYFSAATTLASSAALTANAPVIGGGAGVAPSVGARSGNTTTFATAAGVLGNGNCVSIDGNGNFVDAGGPCTTGGGGGTVSASTIGTVPVYTASTTVTGNTNFTYAAGAVTLGSSSGGTTGALKLAGLTSGTVTVTVAATAGSWTMQLPGDNGTAGYALQTDGAGITTWGGVVTSLTQSAFVKLGTNPCVTTCTVSSPFDAAFVYALFGGI